MLEKLLHRLSARYVEKVGKHLVAGIGIFAAVCVADHHINGEIIRKIQELMAHFWMYATVPHRLLTLIDESTQTNGFLFSLFKFSTLENRLRTSRTIFSGKKKTHVFRIFWWIFASIVRWICLLFICVICSCLLQNSQNKLPNEHWLTFSAFRYVISWGSLSFDHHLFKLNTF